MRLIELIEDIPNKWNNVEIKGIAYDSRSVKKGYMFVARQGFTYDSHNYVQDAIKKGASALVLERDVAVNCIPKIMVKDGRKALALFSNKFYKEPSRKLKVIGITGTNGKTTSALLIKSIYDNMGIKTGLIGTIEHWVGDKKLKACKTTPESLDLIVLLTTMVDGGVKVAICEVSSHALALDRVLGIDFDIACFTTLGRDHLDFHKTMDDYKETKLKLFKSLSKDKLAILNRDDGTFDSFAKYIKAHLASYGTNPLCDVRGRLLSSSTDGNKMEISWERQKIVINSFLLGAHNLHNILLAFTCALEDGVPIPHIKSGIESLERVSGRFELIGNVIIDYAHTPDSLKAAMVSAKKISRGKLISVFGCGGERDHGKRPLMGKIATTLSDYAIITSDNPRRENPDKIINEIVKGVVGKNYKIIPERIEAIEYAIKLADEDDIVLVAGKGHEAYQEIGENKIPFDDRKFVQEFLKVR
jgi:UDP-N-acetylmuramoyl-L-alanyl-D-glutamate--2,6-diaminopimelate ligase